MIKYSHADRTNTVACFRAPYLLNRLCIILAGHHRIIIFNTGKQNAKLWRPRGWLTKTPGFPATHYILLYVMRGPWRCRSDPNKGPSLWHLERSQAADMKMCLSNTHQFIWSTGVNPQTKSNVPAEHIVSSVISKKKKTRKTPKQVGCQRCCLRGTKKSNLQTATDTTALTDGLHSYRFKLTASSDNSLVDGA